VLDASPLQTRSDSARPTVSTQERTYVCCMMCRIKSLLHLVAELGLYRLYLEMMSGACPMGMIHIQRVEQL